MMRKCLVILVLFGIHACKPNSNRSLVSMMKKKEGKDIVSPSISETPETYRTFSSELMLRSEENKNDDQKLHVDISYISEQSIKLDLSDAASRKFLISSTIMRNYPTAEIQTSTGNTWFVYRKEKIKDFHDPTIIHSVTILILKDYSAFTVRLNSAVGERVKIVQGTAVVISK